MTGCGRVEKAPEFTWTGQWEKTDLWGSYQSFIKMADGRIASFVNMGLSKSDCDCPGLTFPGGVVVSFTREPGNLLTWTSPAPVMTWEAINDLPDATDSKRPASNRLMTRTTVVGLPGGEFLGLGAASRDHPPVDGLFYITSFAGSIERVNVVKDAVLAGRDAPRSPMWRYQGKVKGPVGEYQEEVQIPNSMYTSVGNLIFLPDGPTRPDHARPTMNRFLLFADDLGSRELTKDGWLWIVLCYSADGREWFFARDATGAVRNLTPPDGDKEGRGFPFVFRRASDEWWMWRSGWWHTGEGTDAPLGVHEIYWYYSSDGLNWRKVRKDAALGDFSGTNGKPLAMKNMTIYYDAVAKQIHGMLSAWDDTAQGWRKYHNIARVTAR